jgi:hypothetical protein
MLPEVREGVKGVQKTSWVSAGPWRYRCPGEEVVGY